VQDRRGRLIAVVVALWGVAAVTAVMEEGSHQGRQAPLQGVRRHDEVACPRPGGSSDLVGDVKVVRGAIGFADTKKTEEKDHRDEAGDVSGEGGERPGP
jgi:hypothetical protein